MEGKRNEQPREESTRNNQGQGPSRITSNQTLHEVPSNLRIHNPSHPKRRNNPTHPRYRTNRPITPHDRPPLRPTHIIPIPIIQIQSQQMQRRAKDLYARWRQELRCRCTTDRFLPFCTHFGRERRTKNRRQVERREYSQAVADCEEGVRRERDGAGGNAWRPEKADEGLVFEDA